MMITFRHRDWRVQLIGGPSGAGKTIAARTQWLFGERLAGEARQHGVPMLEPRPWGTLVERIVAALH